MINISISGRLKICEKCNDTAGWTFLCLECGYFGCHSVENSHTYSHFSTTGHKLFMDLNSGNDLGISH